MSKKESVEQSVQENRYEDKYNREMKRIKRRLQNKKNPIAYNKEYWLGYEKGIKRIYIGSKEVDDEIHNKLIKLKEIRDNLSNTSKNKEINAEKTEKAERFEYLSSGYMRGIKFAERHLLPTNENIKRGRPPISTEKTKMVGSRIPLSQYEILQKKVKNSSKWIRNLIEQELSKK